MTKLTKAKQKRADIAFALAHGWYFDGYTAKEHLRFRHPGSVTPVFVANTPSDIRTLRNNIRDFKRYTPREETPCSNSA